VKVGGCLSGTEEREVGGRVEMCVDVDYGGHGGGLWGQFIAVA